MKAKDHAIAPYVVGIDLGSHSLGWAVLPLDPKDQPRGIAAAGVRTFEAGVEASCDQMMRGKQKSKAANRRSKRSPRRQFWRRAWRRYKVLKCLIAHDLLRDPSGLDIRKPGDQDRFIKSIDSVSERRFPASHSFTVRRGRRSRRDRAGRNTRRSRSGLGLAIYPQI